MLDEDTGYKGYVPGTWPVTVKADVWSLGILAWRLVLPHVPGHDNSEDDNDARCESWKTGPNTCKGTMRASIFPTDVMQLPEEYSARLYRVIAACLQYHPDDRPALPVLKEHIDTAMAGLDQMYGEEVRMDWKTMKDYYKLSYDADQNRWEDFSIGDPFKPPVKWRKITKLGSKYDDYNYIVQEWGA
jgi:serine/threonine protein kinase